jgi:hybrid cluster-associated redox disulfide protein
MIKMKEKITKNMLLGEVVSKHPSSIEIFMKHGLPCATCGAAFFETIEQGASTHGIDLKALLKDLNKVASPKVKKKKSSK